jgi:hypothetical protein
MKRPRASARHAQLLADQDHDRRASGSHELDNEAVALADSALSEHDSGDDGVAAESFRSRAGFGACIS